MALYENIFIARQDLSPTQVESLTEKFSAIVRDKGGTVEKTEYVGLRTLAYPIRKNRKGYYVLTNVVAAPSTVEELERVMRINEDVLRFLTVKVEEHEKSPSSLLKASHYQRDEYEETSFSEDSEKAEEGSAKKFRKMRKESSDD